MERAGDDAPVETDDEVSLSRRALQRDLHQDVAAAHAIGVRRERPHLEALRSIIIGESFPRVWHERRREQHKQTRTRPR